MAFTTDDRFMKQKMLKQLQESMLLKQEQKDNEVLKL
jgi:hypothetical protein